MASLQDARQWVQRTVLERITNLADSQGDVILPALNSEVTPPLELKATDTPDLVVNVGPITVANPSTNLTRTTPLINGAAPAFTSGTVTFPAASGGNAVPSAGSSIVITVASGNFLKVGILLKDDGDLELVAGTEGASIAAATVPPSVDGTFYIGYVILENVGGTIQNITNSRIIQFVGGGSSVLLPRPGLTTDLIAETFTIAAGTTLNHPLAIIDTPNTVTVAGQLVVPISLTVNGTLTVSTGTVYITD